MNVLNFNEISNLTLTSGHSLLLISMIISSSGEKNQKSIKAKILSVLSIS